MRPMITGFLSVLSAESVVCALFAAALLGLILWSLAGQPCFLPMPGIRMSPSFSR